MNTHSAELATLEALPDPVLAAAASKRYQELCAALLVPDDWQRVSRDKSFVKRSGWVKLAKAYAISVETVATTETRDPDGRLFRATARVRATDPTGRYWESGGACSLDERGRDLSAKPEHDLPATAETRAANRATSSLIGFGEISAEEADPGHELADQELENTLAAAVERIRPDLDGARFVLRLAKTFGDGVPLAAARALQALAWCISELEERQAAQAEAPPPPQT